MAQAPVERARAISCLTRATVRDVIESESLREVAVDCMAEVTQAARTQDLEARKPLEYEVFNGIVVKLLRQAGNDAPVNQVFYGTLEYLDKKFARRHQVKS